jgi:hypothetical protein
VEDRRIQPCGSNLEAPLPDDSRRQAAAIELDRAIVDVVAGARPAVGRTRAVEILRGDAPRRSPSRDVPLARLLRERRKPRRRRLDGPPIALALRCDPPLHFPGSN